MNKDTCIHTNKAYSSSGMALTSMPPIFITNWVCKDCGAEGQDSKRGEYDDEYERTKGKFHGGHNVTVTELGGSINL